MGIKLLLADDSITIQKVVGIIFASEDYDVTIVDNGDVALAKAREIKPDVLLVDAVMPGKSGYEVCEQVRCDPALQRLPILLLTGAFEAFDEDKARKSGADDFISKPFESQNLIEKVNGLIETGRQRAATPPPAGPAVAPAPPIAQPAMEMATPSQSAFPATPPDLPPQPASGIKADSTPAQFTVEVMEGTPDDDLWGAFELDEIVEDRSGQPAVALAGNEQSFVAEVLDEPFSFAEEPEPAVGDTAFEEGADAFEIMPEEEFTLSNDFGTAAVETAADEPFDVFAEDMEATPPTGGMDGLPILEEEPSNLFELDAEESAFFAEPAASPVQSPPVVAPSPSAREDFDFQFAPDEQYVPAAVTAETAGPAVAAAPSPAFTGELTLSEEQLSALVSRISRDILERIAWEVVPDLAETIIRDEIRKIKEGL